MKRISKYLLRGVTVAVALCAVESTAEQVHVAAEPTTVTLKDGSELTLNANYAVDLKVKEPTTLPARKMAIFVRDGVVEIGETFSEQVAALISSDQIEVLDYRDVVAAIAPQVEASGKTMDQELLANTSRVNLAQNMGVDYVLILSIGDFDQEKRQLRDARFGKAIDKTGTTISTIISRLTASYRVLDAYTGTSIGGGMVKASKSRRVKAGLEITDTSSYEGLEEELAESLAEDILENAASWREVSAEKVGIPVSFSVAAYDKNNEPIYLPAYDGESPILRRETLATLAANVEVDGLAVGSTATAIPLTKGIHKVRISYPGYEPLTLHLTPREDMVVSVNLRMTQEEYDRIKDSITFMHSLTKDRELNQAEVKLLEGHAKALEQSGFRFDIKELPEQMIDYRPLF